MKQQTEPMHPILAKFHEAKEAGFEWADDAINDFEEDVASSFEKLFASNPTYSRAIYCGIFWTGKDRNWFDIHEELEKQGL